MLFSTYAPTLVFAADPCDVEFGCFEAPLPGVSETTINDFVKNHKGEALLYYVNFIVKLITGIIVLLGLIMVVIGGYVYMTAGGNANQVGKAKTIIGGALLGIILALTSFLILNTISPQFASGLKEPTFGN